MVSLLCFPALVQGDPKIVRNLRQPETRLALKSVFLDGVWLWDDFGMHTVSLLLLLIVFPELSAEEIPSLGDM